MRRLQMGRAGALTLVAGALSLTLAAAPASAQCVGDCDGDNMVTINNLIVGVNIALGSQPVSVCEAFACTGGDTVPINCLIQGVNNALAGCPATPTPTEVGDTPTATATTDVVVNTPTVTEAPTGTPTATASAVINTPTVTPPLANTPTATTGGNTPTATVGGGDPTPTATEVVVACPLTEGRYTITQLEGGTLQVASIAGDGAGFPFPPGGEVVQDIGPGDADCVHQTVVPADGGFSAPVFCIPGLNFSVQVVQRACGIGQMDSDGGADFTVTEVGDTSDSSNTCDLPAVGCPPGPPSTVLANRDASLRVDITVGDGIVDTCPGGGTGNALVAIPVNTTTWLAANFTCPDSDGVFSPEDTPILVVQQILDFTTDVSTASWSDIDGDGCSIAGAGPAGGLTRTGVCVDIDARTVTTAATGTIGSAGSPLFDLTFATLLPNEITGPEPFGGATCSPAPIIDFAGEATRCIE